VRFGGGPAPAELIGAKVEAVVDHQVCATATILAPVKEGGVTVTPYSPLRVELGVDPQGQLVCGRPQATVQFLIAGSRLAVEQAPWGVGLHQVDLSWPGPLGAGGAKAAPTFQGRVVLLGGPVDDGMVVRAYVGPKLCGMATTTAGSFTLFLHTQESLGGCAKPGDGVRFIVGSQESRQSGVFQRVDQGTSLELTPQ
jgi:hypothetical protein